MNKILKPQVSGATGHEHSGSVDHSHTVHFDPAIVEALKQVRLTVTIIVGGWVAVVAIRALLAAS